MRGNLVFKNVAEIPTERLENIKDILAKVICKDLAWSGQDEIWLNNNIVRAHRGGSTNTNDKSIPRNIYVKFTRHDFADSIQKRYVKNAVHKKSNYSTNCCQQYTKSVQERRDNAMKVRRKLLDEGVILRGHVQYPAKLIVLYPHTKKYTFHSEY